MTPLGDLQDLERDYMITGGNIFHGQMYLDQLFDSRPLASISSLICRTRSSEAERARAGSTAVAMSPGKATPLR